VQRGHSFVFPVICFPEEEEEEEEQSANLSASKKRYCGIVRN